MILARCPECATTFRVAPEQLKARSGRVRCGQCKAVFNAFDALVETPHDHVTSPAGAVTRAADVAHRVGDRADRTPAPTDEISAAPFDEPGQAPSTVHADPVAPVRTDAAAAGPDDGLAPAAPAVREAQAAGLVAARETRAIPGYSKWAERPLASPDTGFDAASRRPRWPARLFALLLLLGLLAQGVYHFRGEIAALRPELRPWLRAACVHLACEVPLPRQAELISIEGSELQADAARGGLLVLQATLKNRAAFAQAYPALELTLTDTQDRAVLRRVLPPSEYLPATADPAAAFAANTELAVKLWLDAREAAAGYRLYVFYP